MKTRLCGICTDEKPCNFAECPDDVGAKMKTEAEFEQMHNDLAQDYVRTLFEILHAQGTEEFNFVKKTITLPNGGIYILQFQHVTGPKFDVKQFYTEAAKTIATESQEAVLRMAEELNAVSEVPVPEDTKFVGLAEQLGVKSDPIEAMAPYEEMKEVSE